MSFFYTLIFLGAMCFCSQGAYATETITVAVASSLYTKVQMQAQAYEKEHDVKIRLVSGSTGRLYNQIIQGAPFDVFIAADTLRPNNLMQQGKAIATFPMGIGYLGLTLGKQAVVDLKLLSNSKIQHIAIANPDVAPFGLATKRLLQKHRLWQKLKSKFVYAQNALQARMLIEKDLVDAAFVPVMSVNTALAIISYQGVLLKSSKKAHSFLNKFRNHAMLSLEM